MGQQVNQMMVLKLVKTYCLPRLLYGCGCLQCFDAVGWAAGRASGL